MEVTGLQKSLSLYERVHLRFSSFSSANAFEIHDLIPPPVEIYF